MSYIIDRQGDQFVTEVSAAISESLAKRFPDGSPEEFMAPMAEAMIEAFWNGARWAETALRDEDQSVKAEAARLVL